MNSWQHQRLSRAEEVQCFVGTSVESCNQPQFAQKVVLLASNLVQFLDEKLKELGDVLVKVLVWRDVQERFELIKNVLEVRWNRPWVPKALKVAMELYKETYKMLARFLNRCFRR